VDKSAWNTLIGPFRTLESVAELRGETIPEVRAHAADDEILLLRTSAGDLVAPAFQFGPASELLPSLPEVTAVLRTGVDDPWTWAQWLNSTPRPPGVSFAQRLRNGDVEGVLATARATAAAWAP
jgi:hypothetical protein